ncbi:futalosine hydrolase [Paenibacillus albiflavus]|uniref:Futalosine hydrolase n=1 Tax=Paenibacillus albiflavus TaxID=2545760 RepID=A0A4R4EKP2_9BACL|nr:futalosine hydrolase [Paenibacillus albiflavus]TCZ79880.1 futalosine hydrolase [Paenibacillus albiflavus]
MQDDVKNSTKPDKRILIMTAVEAEREAVLRGLQADNRFDVKLAGVGPAAAGANTAFALQNEHYGLVISAGIGGGFIGQADIGSIVISSEIIAADLGAETPDGYLSVDELGFGSSRISVDPEIINKVTAALSDAHLPTIARPILTVTTVTGSQETALELSKRVPGATAEAMEGYGVAIAAQIQGIPAIEIRAISNAVGPRDRSAWRIGEALQALEQACSILKEVL